MLESGLFDRAKASGYFGPEFDPVASAEGVRAGWKAEGVPMGERRPLLLRALNALYEKRGAA